MTRADSGFSLAEVLIATTVMLVVTGAVFTLLQRVAVTFDAQPEMADVQQRLRTGVMSLQRELLMAGAGGYAGAERSPLCRFLGAVQPYRWGADPSVSFRADVISVAYVPGAPAHAGILAMTVDEAPFDALIELKPETGAKRFAIGMRVVLFEPGGAWNLAVVTEVQGDTLNIRAATPLAPAFAAGSGLIAELSTHTYYLKVDESTKTYQLMHFDGAQTDLPVVDNVISLRFRYWTGSAPEAIELTGAELTDGPWLPDAGSALRYDADLLRIRRIEVMLRVRAGAEWLRSQRGVSDQEITFDVAPPNLNLDR